MSVRPDMLTNQRAGYAGKERIFKERIFKCRCYFAEEAILISFFWQAGLSIFCSPFLTLAVFHTFPHSLSLSRARSLVCFGKRALAFYAHISSLSIYLSLSLTHISSLSIALSYTHFLSLYPVFVKRALPRRHIRVMPERITMHASDW
jgi:hypothetical protein